jgi:branched-chain amino acid aminotransferase
MLVHTGDAIVPAAEATVPLLDRGFLYGDSVYEVVRTANGRPFLMREHLERMEGSAALLYFVLPWSRDEIGRRFAALCEAVGEDECYVRLVATRGPGPIALQPPETVAPRLYLIGAPLPRLPERLYTDGCAVAVVPRLRNDARALDPRAKTGNYLNNMLGLMEAQRAGADDALFLNVEGSLTESTTSNVWLVHGGRVVTPSLSEGLLAGITRAWMLRALPGAGVETEARVLDAADLERADEVFLSGTVKGVMPVTRIDGRPVGNGRPGPVAATAARLYDEALARN